MAELRILFECFAHYKLMDVVDVDAINALVDDTRRDQSLRERFKSVSRCLYSLSLLPLLYYIWALIRCLK